MGGYGKERRTQQMRDVFNQLYPDREHIILDFDLVNKQFECLIPEVKLR